MITSVEELPIKGAYLFNIKSYNDHRGKYVETWNEQDYKQYLPEGERWKQDDFSHSYQKTLRGLHGDYKTWKLIQCIYGSINFVMFDVFTHQTYEIILLASKPQQILVPSQCANGHLCLTPECIFQYKQTTLYGETNQFTVKWNDPMLKDLKWAGMLSSNQPILSDRDAKGPFSLAMSLDIAEAIKPTSPYTNDINQDENQPD